MTSMKSLTIASVFFLALMVLEWLFWLSPLKRTLERWFSRMGVWFYVFQPHYIIRVLVLCAIVRFWSSQLNLWPVFAGGRNGFRSFVLGVLLSALSLFSLKVPHRVFWQKVRQWYQEDRRSFVGAILYLLVYPGFVEELLFRWFFTATLWPSFRWWTLVLVPALNMIWHLPIWGMFKGKQWQEIIRIVIPITTFVAALTAVAIITTNILGPLIAHAFGDWCSLVLQRNSSKAS